MRFESKKQREELIESFKIHAEELTQKNIEDFSKKKDKNSNPAVKFDTVSEFDEVTKDGEEILEFDKEGNELLCTGEIYVFFIKQPRLFDSIKIMESGDFSKPLTKSLLAWDAMILLNESSPEITQDRIKLGYLRRLIPQIEALLSDQKKN